MASTNNTGRNKFKETDLPPHLRLGKKRGGNQQINLIFSSTTDTSDKELKQYTAGEDGNKNDVMMLKDDGLAYKALAESTYVHRIIGIATENYEEGKPVVIKIVGNIVDNSFTFDTTKLIYLRNTGSISQTQLTAITGSEDMDVLIGLPLSEKEFKLLTPFQYITIL